MSAYLLGAILHSLTLSYLDTGCDAESDRGSYARPPKVKLFNFKQFCRKFNFKDAQKTLVIKSNSLTRLSWSQEKNAMQLRRSTID